MSQESAENRPETYSGQQFIEDLEKSFGAKLHIGINPIYLPRLSDISATARQSLRAIYEARSQNTGYNPVWVDSGDMVSDFKGLFASLAPHQDEATNPIHLLADPFCRGEFVTRVENFLANAAIPPVEHAEGDPLIVDEYFILDGPDGIIFTQTPDFPTLSDYLYEVRKNAQSYTQSLGLTPEQEARFTSELDHTYARMSAYFDLYLIEHAMGKQNSELHPIVELTCGVTYLILSNRLKNLPEQSVDELPEPNHGIFEEVRIEYDTDPYFGHRMFDRMQIENRYLANFIGRAPRTEIEAKYIQDYVTFYYELFARTARRGGLRMLHVTEETIQKLQESFGRKFLEDHERRGARAVGLELHLAFEKLTEEEAERSPELKKFWRWLNLQMRNVATDPEMAHFFGFVTSPLYETRRMLYEQQGINRFKKTFPSF